MAIDTKLLAPLKPLLQKALTSPIASAPNVINALQNNYDIDIINNLFQNLYDKEAQKGIDRYTIIDALNALDNKYAPSYPEPAVSAYDATQVFNKTFNVNDAALKIANDSINNTTNQEWLDDSAEDDFLDMLWKRNNREPMYNKSNKYVYSKK